MYWPCDHCGRDATRTLTYLQIYRKDMRRILAQQSRAKPPRIRLAAHRVADRYDPANLTDEEPAWAEGLIARGIVPALSITLTSRLP
jgi:hypothetical protein